jgi:MFS family permease
VTFFISALLVSFITRSKLRVAKAREIVATGREMAQKYRSVLQEVMDGIRYIFAHREIRTIINLMMILFMAAGAIYVVIIVFVQQSFHSVTKHLGFLAVGLGVGLFLGSLAYGKWGDKKKHIETIYSCLVAGGIMMVVFSFAVQQFRNIWVAQALAGLLGFVVGPIVIAANTVVHTFSLKEMQGKVFSAMEFAIHFGFLVTMLVSSKLSEFIGAFWILAGVGVIFCGVGLFGMVSFRERLSCCKESG